jgi:hypothetical protein
VTDSVPVIEPAVRSAVRAGSQLSTPSGRGQFVVRDIDTQGVVLLLGAGQYPVHLPWTCLEGVTSVLASGDWVPIGSSYRSVGEEGTLDGYLKGCTKTATAGWVAALLEAAGLVEIDRSRPARVRWLSVRQR